MKTKAKIALIGSDYKTTIAVPKNVKLIKIAIIDKAGNISYYTQDMAPNLFIGYTEDTILDTSLIMTSNIYSKTGINTLAVSKSYDGVSFTNETVYSLVTGAGITSKQIKFTDLSVCKIYIKLVATSNAPALVETRIVCINLSTNVPAIWGNSIDQIVDSVPIPKGFTYMIGTKKSTGLVIQDIEGNQFVWIPVKDGIGVNGDYTAGDVTTVQYKKWCTQGASYSTLIDDVLPVGVNNESNQITKYGGFYIGRYEAGSVNGYVVSKRNAAVYAFINYANSKIKAESMYNTDVLKSGLLTGTQYDTVMKWILNTGVSVTNSTTWGNYNNSVAPANISGYGVVKVAGYTEFWKVNNIYDIAGNLWEWTNEKDAGTNLVYRGGSHSNSGSVYASSYRFVGITTVGTNLTFRVALFIL